MGNTVKVDDLAIFKVSVIGNGCAKLYDPDTDKTISASIGSISKTDKTGAAVQSLKLLAQATGEYTRDELNKVAKLAWTDKAAAEIAAAKAAALGGGGSNGGGSEQNSGSEQQSEGVTAPEISGSTTFTDSTEVTIQGPQGAEVRYTTDGSDPSAESTLYSEAITLSATTTIKAIAILDGETSAVASKTFTKSGESGGFDLGN
jgi:hypothetical protein